METLLGEMSRNLILTGESIAASSAAVLLNTFYAVEVTLVSDDEFFQTKFGF